MRKLFIFFCIIILSQYAIAQKAVVSSIQHDIYIKQWEKITKLLDQNKTNSALYLIDSVYDLAKAKNDQVVMLKAQFYLLKVLHDTSDNVSEDLILAAEQHIKYEKFPYNAIWQSIAAEFYQNYYQLNRFKILQRPKISMDVVVDDIDQWDVNRFFDKIASLYLRSISHSDGLKFYSIKNFTPLLTGSDSAMKLLPTLFDLLVYRTLSFLNSDEKDIAKPENAFSMNDPTVFAPAGGFVNQKFGTQDLASYKWLSLQWYKQLLLAHEGDSSKDVYLDIDLRRLAFVYKNSVLADKKELYQQALQFIEASYGESPVSAEASYAVARLMCGLDPDKHANDEKNQLQSMFELPEKSVKINYDLVIAKLNDIIAKYPHSTGGKKAKELLNYIENKHISFETEKIILPGEPSKFLLTYRNTNKVYVKVVQLSNFEYRRRINTDEQGLSRAALKRYPIYLFQSLLPGYEDHYEHRTEVKIGALPPGVYGIYVSLKNNFTSDSNVIQNQFIQVSSLAYLAQQEKGGTTGEYVFNRKTGEPVAHATVIRHKSYESRNISEKAKTHKDGSFTFKRHRSDLLKGDMIIVSNRDTLFEELNIKYLHEEAPIAIRTFYFTDNSTYYPGQIVNFKGISVQKKNLVTAAGVLKNRETEVQVSDKNELFSKVFKFRTNNFGSFSGSFKIPENIYPGELVIKNETGETIINVVEATMHKLSIKLESSKPSFNIQDNIRLRGVILSETGNKLEGVNVKYKILRTVKLYNDWKYYTEVAPDLTDKEVFNGTTQTDKDGKFFIILKAIPDENIDTLLAPVYTYDVVVEAEDPNNSITGTSGISIHATYSTLHLSEDIPTIARAGDLDTFQILASDANGKNIPAVVNFRITRLESPDRVLRHRLWKQPDVYIMDSLYYVKNFPNDEYKKETNPIYWKRAEIVFDTLLPTSDTGLFVVPASAWKINSWYEIYMQTRDKKGHGFYKKKFVEVCDKEHEGYVADPLLIYTKINNPLQNSVYDVEIGSSFDSCTILQSEKSLSNNLPLEKFHLTGNLINWEKQISDNDKGGELLSFFTFRDNRFYSKTIVLDASVENKALNLTLVNQGKPKFEIKTNASKNEKTEILVSVDDQQHATAKFNYAELNDFLYPRIKQEINWSNDITAQSSFHLGGNTNLPLLSEPANLYSKLIIDDKSFGLLENSDNKDTVITDYSLFAANSSFQGSFQYDINEHGLVGKKTPLESLKEPSLLFNPHSLCDTSGAIQFDLPHNNTNSWKIRAFAHNENMSFGWMDTTIKSSKEYNIMPFFPRFFTHGDTVMIFAKIVNLIHSDINCNIRLHLSEATTGNPLDSIFILGKTDTNLNLYKDQTFIANWTLVIPQTFYSPVRIDFYDSINNILFKSEVIPVLSDKVLLEKVQPVIVNGNGIKNLVLNNSLNGTKSFSGYQKDISFDFIADPELFYLKSLQRIKMLNTWGTEKIFTQYYANSIALDLLQKSNVLQNFINKSEQFKDEFQFKRLSHNCNIEGSELNDFQLESGAFPWYKGMDADRTVTQKILIGLGRLAKLGINGTQVVKNVVFNALYYADRQILKDYEYLVKNKADFSKRLITNEDVQCLYMRSYFKGYPIPKSIIPAYDFFKKQALSYHNLFNVTIAGMAALSYFRNGEDSLALEIMKPIKDSIQGNLETGLYFNSRNSYWWFDDPAEERLVMIECFNEIMQDSITVNGLKRKLVSQMLTDEFTGINTCGIYSLLSSQTNYNKSSGPFISISTGKGSVNTFLGNNQMTDGIYSLKIPAQTIEKGSNNVSLSITNNDNNLILCSITRQYYDTDAVKYSVPVTVKKQYFINSVNPTGSELMPLKDTDVLKIGDKIVERIEINVEKDMEYIHITDKFAASTVPKNYYDTYRYTGGVGYYQITNDESNNYYIDHLYKGKYSFDCNLTVMYPGTYNGGTVTLKCINTKGFKCSCKAKKLKVHKNIW